MIWAFLKKNGSKNEPKYNSDFFEKYPGFFMTNMVSSRYHMGTYANQMHLKVALNHNERKTTLSIDEEDIEIKECQPKYIQRASKNELERNYQNNVICQSWLGNYMTQRWHDTDLCPDSFEMLRKWKNIPDTVHSVNTSITQQLIPTKVYRMKKLQEPGTDLTSRSTSFYGFLFSLSHFSFKFQIIWETLLSSFVKHFDIFI